MAVTGTGNSVPKGGVVVPIAGCDPVPWANGGGITRVIATRAGVYRLSLATIAEPGPFSPCPALVRHFALVAGAVGLSGPDAPFPVDLDTASPPLTFAGHSAVHAVVHAGPALALNLMVPVGAPPLQMERCDDGVVRNALAVFACAPLWVDLASGRVDLALHDTLFPDGSFRVTGPALVVR